MSQRTDKIVAAAERLARADAVYREAAIGPTGRAPREIAELTAAQRELFAAVEMQEEPAAFEAEYLPGVTPGGRDLGDLADGIARACKLAQAGGRSFIVSVRAEVREIVDSELSKWAPQFPDRLRMLLRLDDDELGALAWASRWAGGSPFGLMKSTQRLGLRPDLELLRRDAALEIEALPRHLPIMKQIGKRLRATIEELAPKACGTCNRRDGIAETLGAGCSNCNGGEG